MKSACPPVPALRPLRALPGGAVQARLVAALAAADGLAGAQAIHELWMRRAAPPAQIDALLERLWQAAADSIPDWLPMRHVAWLEFAYQVAGQFRAVRRGRSHIYLVLLDYSDRRGEPHGVYVGMTSHAPGLRFDQHKQGIRAARSVTRRGLELLTGPVQHLQFIARPEAARIEAELADALRALGLQVEGGH
ncbi:MAG: hypothetical protein QM718_13965 [Steroidobacteraceae bacterium]